MLSNVRSWLTDQRRKALHAAVGSLAALLVAAGYVNDSQQTALVGLVGSGLVLVQALLGLSLLRPSEAAVWFDTVGRGMVYGLAAAAGAFGVAFSWWTPDVVTYWAGLISLGLTVVSSFVAVVNVQTAIDVRDAPGVPRITTLGAHNVEG